MAERRSLQVGGDRTILERPMLGLFCSVRCPGNLILSTYDLAKRLRASGVTVISGFHSPMEQECFRILLRSRNPVVWALARGMYARVPTTPVDSRLALDEGRLAIVSPFPERVRHVTVKNAIVRNRLVVEMATAVVVAHAAPGSKMEALGRETIECGRPLFTFDDPANRGLLGAGARHVDALDAFLRESEVVRAGAPYGEIVHVRVSSARKGTMVP